MKQYARFFNLLLLLIFPMMSSTSTSLSDKIPLNAIDTIAIITKSPSIYSIDTSEITYNSKEFSDNLNNPDSIGLLELRETLVITAKKYVKTKYKWGGITSKGFDCSGFIQYVFKENKKNIPRNSVIQSKEGKNISLDKTKKGDLVFFSKNSKRISHVAMVIHNTPEELLIIHATNRGVVIDNLLESEYWSQKVLLVKDILSYKNTNYELL